MKEMCTRVSLDPLHWTGKNNEAAHFYSVLISRPILTIICAQDIPRILLLLLFHFSKNKNKNENEEGIR